MTDQPETPARGYSWAPFEPGHEVTMRHGAYSERRVAPLAAQIEQEARAMPSWPKYLDSPEYGAAVVAWSRAEAICRLLFDFATLQDVEALLTDVTEQESEETAGKGRVSRRGTSRQRRSVLDQLARWEQMAAARRARLGLDPLSRARLGKDVAATQVDMATWLSAERERIERAQGDPGMPSEGPGGAL